MKKTYVIALAISSITFQQATAQLKGFSVGPYVEAGWPAGKFKNSNSTGLGAGLSADIKLPASLGITGSIGYMQFSGVTLSNGQISEKTSPVKAFPMRLGLKFRALPILYFKVEGGSAKFNGGEGSAFIASPGVGIRVLGIDLQGKYEAWFKQGTHINFWGLRAGINF